MKKTIVIGLAIVLIAILTSIWVSKYNSANNYADLQPAMDTTTLTIHPPKYLYGQPIDSMIVIEGRIRRDQFLSEILQNYNVPYQKIHELSIISKPVFDVRKIAYNCQYTLICYPDSLHTAKAMIYQANAMEYIIFGLGDSITVEKIERKIDLVEKKLVGVIDNSLAETMDNVGGSPQLTNDFADVLAWQIDFFRLQKGDKFKVIYDEKQVEGEAIGVGKIKGIYFNHFGNDYYAYYYNQGSGVDYFDGDGNSLRKALLKYPLDFTRISSRYSGNRFHPVQKRWKAHKGTDFAAPKGTPIRTVGDGIVLEAEYSQNNGNYVKIKHNATYTTQYLHMSKIATDVRRGAKVRQGQTIGFVGSTGLATGDHLCYRFWKNGVQVDALKVDLPPSEPIQEKNKADFIIVRDSIKQQLDSIGFPITGEVNRLLSKY